MRIPLGRFMLSDCVLAVTATAGAVVALLVTG
jgi:hypothetical protein